MGYSTEFNGQFELDRVLDSDTYDLLYGLSTTRRMKRLVNPEYGVDGEFYIEDDFTDIVERNSPPATKPSLWCSWEPTEDLQHIQWNGAEKFYCYVEWLEYLINNILSPGDYTLNGEVWYQGDDDNDFGSISIVNNRVTHNPGRIKSEAAPTKTSRLDTIRDFRRFKLGDTLNDGEVLDRGCVGDLLNKWINWDGSDHDYIIKDQSVEFLCRADVTGTPVDGFGYVVRYNPNSYEIIVVY